MRDQSKLNLLQKVEKRPGLVGVHCEVAGGVAIACEVCLLARPPAEANMKHRQVCTGNRLRYICSVVVCAQREPGGGRPAQKRLFPQVFFCLSQACLGKMIIFSIKTA